jgi:peptidoglycan/xylan/chitin deacetylase (PgdA/CDA1 family)
MNRMGAGAAVLAAGGFAVFHGQWPTSQLYGATICRSRSGERKVAFSYDDGPNPAHTPKLMQILDRYDAKATFFLIGRWAEREPQLIRELDAAGHAIGNHTHTHPTMPLLSAAGVTEELARCRSAVEASGVEFSQVDGAALMRPPYGRRRPGTLRAMRAAGYVPVTWSVTCYDWRRTATQGKIARRARRAIEGDVILLHDGSHTGPAVDRSNSVAATEDALRKLSDQGYEFVTVPELVGA